MGWYEVPAKDWWWRGLMALGTLLLGLVFFILWRRNHLRFKYFTAFIQPSTFINLLHRLNKSYIKSNRWGNVKKIYLADNFPWKNAHRILEYYWICNLWALSLTEGVIYLLRFFGLKILAKIWGVFQQYSTKSVYLFKIGKHSYHREIWHYYSVSDGNNFDNQNSYHLC